MYLFILGTLFGMGLILAIQTVAKSLRARRVRKSHELEAEVQRRVEARLNLNWDEKPYSPGSRQFVPIRHP